MPRRSPPISISLLAAVRDGDLRPAEGARRSGVSRQVFDNRIRKFLTKQAKQRIRKALRACAGWLAYCRQIGFAAVDLDDLERLWWRYHDEGGNLLSTARYVPR
jgi:hypothetical protein